MIIMSFRYEPHLLPEGFCPSEYDAICGWARQNFGHAGNRRLREIISQNVPVYRKAKTKSDKGKIIVDLCKQLILASPSRTGFVKLDTKTGRWFFIGYEKSKDKVGHALRKASQQKAKKARSASEGDLASESSPVTTQSEKPISTSDTEERQQPLQTTSTDVGSRDERQQGSSTEPLHIDHTATSSAMTATTSTAAVLPDTEERSEPHHSAHVSSEADGGIPRVEEMQAMTQKPSNSSQVLRFVIGSRSSEPLPTSSMDDQRRERQNSISSPVRRSIFDSPVKASPIPLSRINTGPPLSGNDTEVSIPLPLGSTRKEEVVQQQDRVEENPKVRQNAIQESKREGEDSLHALHHQQHTQQQGHPLPPTPGHPPTAGIPGGPMGQPYPYYYYPLPHPGYMYYPVPAHQMPPPPPPGHYASPYPPPPPPTAVPYYYPPPPSHSHVPTAPPPHAQHYPPDPSLPSSAVPKEAEEESELDETQTTAATSVTTIPTTTTGTVRPASPATIATTKRRGSPPRNSLTGEKNTGRTTTTVVEAAETMAVDGTLSEKSSSDNSALSAFIRANAGGTSSSSSTSS